MTTEEVSVITTGSTEIDRRLGGGIPYNTVMLIEGQDASGKSTFAQQLLWGTLNAGHKASIYTTEQNVHALLRQMESLGQDVTDYFLLNDLQIFPMTSSVDKEDPNLFFKLLSDHIWQQDSSRMIIIDSLTTFVSRAGGEQIQDFFNEMKNVCERGQVIACTVHENAFDEEFLLRVRSICDAYLRFQVNASGTSLVKTMEVAKIRGADMRTGNILGFEVEPGMGIRIVPISRAKA
ncbi:MAG: ATPase domain-containing protein [Dehalococcoidia bacterium]|tara:strand:- start:479 stop:1183 length:705 start_codon:yes stop_codon:yes gene_type:complete